VGINSAFIQTEDDFLVALNLDIGQAAAETLFNGIEKILIINNNVWLPLSMNAFNDGFIAAWTQGAAVLNETFAAGKDLDFIIVEEAWAFFPPAPLPSLSDRNIIHTDIDATTNEVYLAVWMYMVQEIVPLIEKTRTERGNLQAGSPTEAALYNRLGILYIRSGQFNEGKAAYEQAAQMGFVPAMTNRGNLALIERDFTVAERWFRQALHHDNQNRTALRGLDRIAGSR
jgi:tetratricopeptide (TPR) repeat protein